MAMASAERHQPLERLRERILAALDKLRAGRRSGRRGTRNGHANRPAPFMLAGPSLEISETDDAVLVRAELPGFGPNDFSVNATRDRLILRGRKQEEHEERTRGLQRFEVRAGEFYRSVALPSEIDPDRATATFRDGLLRVTLPKTGAARARQMKVAVRSG